MTNRYPIRPATLALAFALVLPGPALSQDTSPDDPFADGGLGGAQVLVEVRDSFRSEPFRLDTDDLEGMEVYGTDDEPIGEVEAVLVGRGGNVVALLVESDSLLGLRDRYVVISADDLERTGSILVAGFTAEALQRVAGRAE